VSTPTSIPSRVRFAADQTAAPVRPARVAQEKLSICQLATKMAASINKKYPLEGSHLQIMLSPDESDELLAENVSDITRETFGAINRYCGCFRKNSRTSRSHAGD
jgi:hypothetical protein